MANFRLLSMGKFCIWQFGKATNMIDSPVKFSIVTPCFERAKFLDQAIRSVLSQEGDFEIQYVIQRPTGAEYAAGLPEKGGKRRIQAQL